MVPDFVYRPSRVGVVLCPPYAGGILAKLKSLFGK